MAKSRLRRFTELTCTLSVPPPRAQAARPYPVMLLMASPR